MLNDPLANAMSLILNDELVGRSESLIKPASKLIREVLDVMKKNGYLGDYTDVENSRGNYLKLALIGGINKCGVIKPRYNVKFKDFEKFEKRYLPSKNVGILIVSTQKGIITHNEAKSKKTGGRLLAYCY
jgi:small subunit ribosomal protein S8